MTDHTHPATATQLEMTGELRPNAGGAQLYFEKAFRSHPGFPLECEHDVRAIAVPNEAVVLLPEQREPNYPLSLTVHDPQSYSFEPTITTD